MNARRLRVLYISHTASNGGPATSLRHVLKVLHGRDIEACVASPDGPALEGFRRIGVRVAILPGASNLMSIAGAPLTGLRQLVLLRELASLRHGGPLRALMRQLRPDLVHCNEQGLVQAACIASSLGIPVVMHARSLCDARPSLVLGLCHRLIARHVDSLIPIDRSVDATVPWMPRRSIIYNPVPLAAETTSPAGDGRMHVAYVGNLLAYKGIWDLLAAARQFAERKDIHVHFVGGNSRPDAFLASWRGTIARWAGLAEDNLSALRSEVERLGLAGTVTVHGHLDDPGSVLRRIDVVVFPSHLDGIGRCVFEAGMFGIPSVVCLRTPSCDIVRDGRNGLIVPERDPTALAGAIRSLADDSNLRRRLGTQARLDYTAQFEAGAVAARLLALYHRILGRRAMA